MRAPDLSNIETGRRPISEDRLDALAHALGVTTSWLRYGLVGDEVDIHAIREQARKEGQLTMAERVADFHQETQRRWVALMKEIAEAIGPVETPASTARPKPPKTRVEPSAEVKRRGKGAA